MRKVLRKLISATLLLVLPIGATAHVTTFDNKIITISQQNFTSTTYLSSSDGESNRCAWTTTDTPTAENLFFYDATNKKLVSVTTGQVLRLTASNGHATWNSGTVDATVEFDASTASGYETKHLVRIDSDTRSLFNAGGAKSDAGKPVLVSTTTKGYILTVEEATAPAATFENKLGEYFTNTFVVPTSSTAYGEYSCTELDVVLTECKGISTSATFDAIKEAVSRLSDAIVMNVPKAGDFLRIRSVADNSYYLAAGSVTKVNTNDCASFETGKEATGETIFYYDGFHLINYSLGFSLANNSNFCGYAGEGEGTTITFQASTGATGQFNIYFLGTSGNRCLYCNTSTGRTDAGGTVDASAGYRYTLEKVTELPLTVSEAGYATFIAPVALEIPNDVEAYMVDEEPADGKIKVKKVTETTNNGLIVKANPGTYNFPIVYQYENPTGTEISDYLKGSHITETISQDENVYIFGKKDSKIGFFKMSSGDRQIHAYRAYYCPREEESGEGAAGISAFIIDEGSITGINDAVATDAADTTDASTYDLQGRRVSAPTKGLYIKGGKKIYVK